MPVDLAGRHHRFGACGASDRPASRSGPRALYFIMITLAFGQMFYYFAISWRAYGGEDGLSIWVRNDFSRPEHPRPDPVLNALCFAILVRGNSGLSARIAAAHLSALC